MQNCLMDIDVVVHQKLNDLGDGGPNETSELSLQYLSAFPCWTIHVAYLSLTGLTTHVELPPECHSSCP
jgi:hypothetical protein